MLKYDVEQQKRMTFYRMMIMVAVMIAGGRIASVISREGDTAFLSANDRSRWCAVASLVEDGTYAIDRQVSIEGAKGRHPWNTIDKVRHRGADGKLHYYSSKPPLLTTIFAGVYAFVQRASGMTMTDQPIYLPRIILAIVNLPMLIAFCWYTILVIERLGVGEWPRRVGCTVYMLWYDAFSVLDDAEQPLTSSDVDSDRHVFVSTHRVSSTRRIQRRSPLGLEVGLAWWRSCRRVRCGQRTACPFDARVLVGDARDA